MRARPSYCFLFVVPHYLCNSALDVLDLTSTVGGENEVSHRRLTLAGNSQEEQDEVSHRRLTLADNSLEQQEEYPFTGMTISDTPLDLPPKKGSKANIVDLSLVVLDFEEIDEKGSSITVFIDMQLDWRDERHIDMLTEGFSKECHTRSDQQADVMEKLDRAYAYAQACDIMGQCLTCVDTVTKSGVCGEVIQESLGQESNRTFLNAVYESLPADCKKEFDLTFLQDHISLVIQYGEHLKTCAKMAWWSCLVWEDKAATMSRECELQWEIIPAYTAQVEANQKYLDESGCSKIERVGLPSLKNSEGPYKAEYFDWQRLVGTLQVLRSDAWTPIPTRFIKSEELHATEELPEIIVGLKPKETKFLRAWIGDQKTITFPIVLSYTFFPFDDQEMKMCLDFGDAINPKFVQPEFESVKGRTMHLYTPSEFTDFVSLPAVETLRRKGYDVLDIFPEKHQRNSGAEMCIVFHVQRRAAALWMRFFLPMLLLTTTPFVGFWLPVNFVMPRVATGFISFLSMQVFRSLAYSMVPKASQSLIWLDVVLTVFTELMFLTVIHNIVAVVLHHKVSGFASRAFDTLGRQYVPAVSFLLFFMLIILGNSRVQLEICIVLSQVIIGLMITAITLSITLYLRKLPQRIMKVIIDELISGRLLSSHSAQLDPREFSHVFRLIDHNKSGHVTCDEVYKVFNDYGSHKLSAEALRELDEYLTTIFQDKSDSDGGMSFPEFCHHFENIFGQKASRSAFTPRASARSLKHAGSSYQMGYSEESRTSNGGNTERLTPIAAYGPRISLPGEKEGHANEQQPSHAVAPVAHPSREPEEKAAILGRESNGDSDEEEGQEDWVGI